MRRLPYFSRYRLLVITLGVMVLLVSCKELGQSNILPAAEGIQAPGSYDTGMELVSNYLFCPIIQETDPAIPPGPYDEQVGDCALRGQSTEIEAWLTTLEGIAAICQANRETNWVAALAARDRLDSKVDELEDLVTVIPPTVEIDEEEGEGASFMFEDYEILDLHAAEACTDYNMETMDPFSGGGGDMSNNYTIWLKSIGEDVEKYCTMVDELIKPLWQACDEINFYQDCQAPNPEQYHAIIESKMIAVQSNYDQTDLFYTNRLQNGGWGGFRSSFNEASLDCPLDPQAPNTKFTFFMNTFCRRGPSLEYEKVATFLEGQDVLIKGRNHHEPRWWVVPNPGARGHCWVSDSTGAAEGPIEELEIVAPPPLVINPPDDQPKCSKDLGSSACVAAGGKWVDGGAVGASYCDCP